MFCYKYLLDFFNRISAAVFHYSIIRKDPGRTGRDGTLNVAANNDREKFSGVKISKKR